MRIIKKNEVAGRNIQMYEAAFLDRQVRIPATSIRVADVVEATDERGTPGRNRVLRKADMTVAIHPFELDVMDLSPDPPEEQISEDTSEEQPPPPPVKSLEEVLAERDQEWEAHLQQAVAAAREEGYAQGAADTAARLKAEFEEHRQVLLSDLQHLRTQWDTYLEQLEPALAELSFEIAQAILDAPLPQSIKGVATRAITEAVEQMAGSAPIEIVLHPVDFLRLQESGVVEQLELLHSGLRWEPRPEMKQGEWVVQSPTMAIRRLEEELLGMLRSRLNLLAVVEKDHTHPK